MSSESRKDIEINHLYDNAEKEAKAGIELNLVKVIIPFSKFFNHKNKSNIRLDLKNKERLIKILKNELDIRYQKT